MWFDINFFVVAVQLLPTFRHLPGFMAVARMLVTPIDTLYYKWSEYRKDSLYKMEHTGQVCSLRKSLNDAFDPSERRIYLGEGNDFGKTYVYTQPENKPIYLGRKYIRTKAETDIDLDFIVWVPREVYTQLSGLKSHIDFYRQAGRRYAIFIIP